VPEELDTPDPELYSFRLKEYLLYGDPLDPETVLELGHNADSLAHQMAFVYKDLGIRQMPNSMEIEMRIHKMQRFAAKALMINGASLQSPQYDVPKHPRKSRTSH
jgi:hypothetical protein